MRIFSNRSSLYIELFELNKDKDNFFKLKNNIIEIIIIIFYV